MNTLVRPALVHSENLPTQLSLPVSGKFLEALALREYDTNPDADPPYRDLVNTLAAGEYKETSKGHYRIAVLTYGQAATLWDLADLERDLNSQPGASRAERYLATVCTKVLTRLNEQGIVARYAEQRLLADKRPTPWRTLLAADGTTLGRVYAPDGSDALYDAFRVTRAANSYVLHYGEITPAERAHYHREGAPLTPR